ncbi:CMP-2-keto-3-deoxyoctulosonic acid synthetase [Arabiibacter massiliensis]|uniref:CMP-2-keto-3-deoxyoctulosonic acid synthetase n=1 Tax=Arabiibacter massiliensis TaxID=1870985 RepID=UPI001E629948|nr:CMP-2-keto-3-deoxyoctulosonic acid synthetase [Arabiibacter massiliensis]
MGCASCLVAGCIGIGIASAGGAASHDIDSFGIDAVSAPANESVSDQMATSEVAKESTVLTSTASRDISQGIAAIEAEEEAARIAAEEAARKEEEARIAAAEAAKAEQQAQASQEAAVEATASLPDVDWSVGQEAFIAEWTARIDAYLAGSPLAGQGVTFATAAWNNGVDPRWSPAISNTESSKGAVCFKDHNAWGWGQSSWGSWEEAINAHVAGLASNYGYSITYAFAAKYCPPNTDHWFNATLGQMQMI